MIDWISVKDRLPGVDDYVLWFWDDGGITFDAIVKDDMPQNWTGATHWAKANEPERVQDRQKP